MIFNYTLLNIIKFELESVLKYGEHIFTKCILCDTIYFIGLDIHLLKTQIYC